MTQKITIGNLTVEVFFNEYDKKNKTRKQIAGHVITPRDRAAIINGLDSTDFGEFYRYENDTIEVTGVFNVIEDNKYELD